MTQPLVLFHCIPKRHRGRSFSQVLHRPAPGRDTHVQMKVIWHKKPNSDPLCDLLPPSLPGWAVSRVLGTGNRSPLSPAVHAMPSPALTEEGNSTTEKWQSKPDTRFCEISPFSHVQLWGAVLAGGLVCISPFLKHTPTGVISMRPERPPLEARLTCLLLRPQRGRCYTSAPPSGHFHLLGPTVVP